MARRPLVPQNLISTGMVPTAPQGRVMRRPAHQFTVRSAPWNIQPVAIAPVLPGETLEGARIQARIVTDPLRAKLLGWWTELHLFYVKHRDTAYSDELQGMVLQPTVATGLPTVAGAAGPTYRVHGRPDYVQIALDAVVDWYFRDEGEDHTDHLDDLSGLPLAKLGRSDWTNSLIPTATLTSDDVAVDSVGALYASEVEAALVQYQWLRQNNLTDMTYEDFLATYGVRTSRAEVLKPELLRSIRDWSYPTNTVTQGTGAVTSACVWSIAERVDKKRFFSEPGWLLLVSVTKPKVYRRDQNGAAANVMTDAYTWLPAVLRDDPHTSLVAIDTVNGPLSSVAGASNTFDVRDLLLYGDQFIAAVPSVAGAASVAAGAPWATLDMDRLTMGVITAPMTGGRGDYPNLAGGGMLAARQALFTSAVNAGMCISIEGVISFDIAGSVVDTTPGVPVR